MQSQFETALPRVEQLEIPGPAKGAEIGACRDGSGIRIETFDAHGPEGGEGGPRTQRVRQISTPVGDDGTVLDAKDQGVSQITADEQPAVGITRDAHGKPPYVRNLGPGLETGHEVGDSGIRPVQVAEERDDGVAFDGGELGVAGV